MKNIVIIATGGTIAGSGEAGRTTEYRAGTVAVADILKSVPQLGKLANIEMISLMSVDSNEMNEQKWLQLREAINQQAARDDVDGIVVTHGTDTIEETAYFLSLTVNTAKPVVLTGAMMVLSTSTKPLRWQQMIRPMTAAWSACFPVRSTRRAILPRSTTIKSMPSAV